MKNKILFFLLLIFSMTPWSGPAVALFFGLVLALFFENPFLVQSKEWSSRILGYSVAGLGAGIHLNKLIDAGLKGIGITFISIVMTLIIGYLLGRWLKVDKETSLLVSTGTAICGGSAIAAIAPVIKAKPESVSVSLALVFILNSIALILFPYLGHHFHLSEEQFGLWSAIAIHDTSSVVGATMQYGPIATEMGTTVKLARALWIIPLTLFFSYQYKKNNKINISKVKKPWFILWFVLFAVVFTYIDFLKSLAQPIELLARKGLAISLFLIGSQLNIKSIKEVGINPIIQSIILWIVVTLSSYFILI